LVRDQDCWGVGDVGKSIWLLPRRLQASLVRFRPPQPYLWERKSNGSIAGLLSRTMRAPNPPLPPSRNSSVAELLIRNQKTCVRFAVAAPSFALFHNREEAGNSAGRPLPRHHAGRSCRVFARRERAKNYGKRRSRGRPLDCESSTMRLRASPLPPSFVRLDSEMQITRISEIRVSGWTPDRATMLA
jgi:hypothetical protein